jgi:hypothetical protein
MTLHSLVQALPHFHREKERAPRAGLAVPARLIGPRAELRVYLRRRRRAWKPTLAALAVANAAVLGWAFLLSRIS